MFFEPASKFWLDDGIKSINMEFEPPDISSIRVEPNEIDTHRIILKAYSPVGLSPLRVPAAFRKVYPGKKDTISQALTIDWMKDKPAPACEMRPFPIGEMHRDLLTNRIREGPTGIWRNIQMLSNPELTDEKIQKMVHWILENAADPAINYFSGTEGSFLLKPPAGANQNGIFILTAVY